MNRKLRAATTICISALALCALVGHLRAQPTVTITAPESGAVVYSGADLVVTVETSPENAFQRVVVLGPFSTEQIIKSSPYRFSARIITRTSPGRYSLYAYGVIGPGDVVASRAVDIQVEHSGAPLRLTAQPPLMAFQSVGEEQRASAIAEFADASFFIDHSTEVKYSSDDTAVATVDSEGQVKAIAPGRANITIEYQGVLAVARAIVHSPPRRR